MFSASDRALAYELAGTHPLLLQAAAACVFDARRDFGSVDRRFVLDRFMDLTEHQWQDLWRWSNTAEHELLIKLARHAQEGNALLEKRPSECRSLLKRGLVIREPDAYRLFSPTLRLWLLDRVAESAAQSTQHYVPTRPVPGSMVFVSYSRKDEAEKDALLTHLRVLQNAADMVEIWSDDEIGGGETWELALEKAMSRAKVAILLVTANFLSSNFILGNEVPALLKRREQDGVTVIPVIARACAWKTVPWLARMNVRPRHGQPVWQGGSSRPDDALAAVAEEVAGIVSGGTDK